MKVSEKLLKTFPLSIDRSKPIFSSLIANSKETGTIEKVLNDLVNYMAEKSSENDIYEMSGDAFFYTYKLITFIEMFEGESEDDFKKRLQTLYVRDGDKVWGTPYDIQKLFQAYFNLANVYVIENVNGIQNNLVQDFEFEEEAANFWDLINCQKSKEARFSKSKGVEFADNGICKQQITVNESSKYFLHFFHSGRIEVSIKDVLSGKFWTGNGWSNTEVKILKDSEDWESSEIFFTSLSDQIEIIFNADTGTYLDYVTVYEYLGYPSFKVLVQYYGGTSGSALKLAPGTRDEEGLHNYQNASYYEDSYLTGTSSGFSQKIYEDLLQIVKSEGVKAYMEIITRDL